MNDKTQFHIGIIGAGPSGIAAGRELLRQGMTEFTVFEASDGIGGTWHLQDYPGLSCDVWAHAYTYSWALNPEWSANFVPHDEIARYFQRCAAEAGVTPHVQFNTCVERASWDGHSWQVEAANGERFSCTALINAMGNQYTPLYPDVPGMDSFEGETWHSVHWNHDLDLSGKRVAVVGSAASAVQIVPELAKTVEHLTVLQRSANWIMPRNYSPYSDRRRALYRRFPFLMRLTRWFQRKLMSEVQNAVTIGHPRVEQFEKRVIKFIDSVVDDPELREQLIPDTRYGCKRGLVSDDFYPALVRDNVELIAEGLAEVTPTGLVTRGGREVDVDVIVYCTGYRILDFDRIDVRGEDNRSLAEDMARSPDAYKGMSVPGFPNYFFAVGPNALVLNAPYMQSAEKSLHTIVRLLGDLRANGASSMDVQPDKHRGYIDWMESQFDQFTWGVSTCNSYYQSADSHPPFLFPGDFKSYCRLLDESSLEDYSLA